MVSSFMFQVSGSISEFSQSETNNLKLETRNSKLETRNLKRLNGIRFAVSRGPHGDRRDTKCWVRLPAREQANKFRSRDDEHTAVVRGLEILVAGNEVLRWGFRRQQIKKHTIPGITDGGRTRDWDD